MPIPQWAVTLFSSVLLCIPAVAQQQQHPDFSGTWKQNNERSQRKSQTVYTNKILWQEPELHVTTMTEGTRGEFAYTRAYTIGAAPKLRHNKDGEDKQQAVKWDGDALVFDTTEGDRHTVETWRLSEGGRVLTKTIQKGNTQQVYILEKQP